MVAKIVIAFFLEDRAHETFFKAFVTRIAADINIPSHLLSYKVITARHGSKVIRELKDTLKLYRRRTAPSPTPDIFIVAIDGNCKGFREKARQVQTSINIKPTDPLFGNIVYAVPDPHIERWYLLDQKAFKDGVGTATGPTLPEYKCKQDYYKNLIREKLAEEHIIARMGGAEYGGEIAMRFSDIYALRRQYNDIDYFVDQLLTKLRRVTGQ